MKKHLNSRNMTNFLIKLRATNINLTLIKTLLFFLFLIFNLICYSRSSNFKNHFLVSNHTVIYIDFKTKTDTITKEKISLKDVKEISFQAQDCIHSYQNLLNFIAFNDNVPTDLEEAIKNSYTPSTNRVFYSNDVIIEDDVDPTSDLSNKKDNSLVKYLKNFDLQYQKIDSASIKFSNIYLSDVKKKDWIYVRARFNAYYGNKYLLTKSTYSTRQREALIRLENTGTHKWHALIISVGFYDPSIPLENKDDNLLVATDSTSEASLVSQEEYNREKQNFISAKQEEEKKQEKIFDDYIKEGNDLFNNKQYIESLQLFEKAKELKPLVPTLERRIIELKKLASEYTYDNYKLKGDNAKNQHNYKEAIQFYQTAISLKPDQASVLQPEISNISKKMAVISLPNIKLQSGDYKGAILECEKIISDQNIDKNEFPELYLIEALSYQKLINVQSTFPDSKNIAKALENFNLAIDHFFDFKEGRIQRAKFLVNYKNDIASAITDYDVLTTNELDISPFKPALFVAKAKLKEKLNIINGANGAFADYQQALSLNPKIDSIYLFKGQLEYKLGMSSEADKSLSEAIKLNPKFSMAFFFRGLNFIKNLNYKLAGDNFFIAEKLGIDHQFKDTISYLCSQFLDKGRDLVAKSKLDEADSIFNIALKIDRCNSDVFFGKAQILLLKGDEAKSTNKLNFATQLYNNSIALIDSAIKCRPVFYEAYYKQGIAYLQLSKFDFAMKSFSNAIKCDTTLVDAKLARAKLYFKDSKYKEALGDLTGLFKNLSDNLLIAKRDNVPTLIEELNNKLTICYLLYGKCQYYEFDFNDAITSLDRAYYYDKKNDEVNYFLGLSYVANFDNLKAIKYFEQAISILPMSTYYFANGKSYYFQKDYTKAIENFSNAIAIDSSQLIKDKYYYRGLAYLKNNLFKESLEDFDEYNKSEASKTDSSFYTYYGYAQLFNNQVQLASNNFNKALNFNKNYALALYGLGCCYAINKGFNKALEYFEKSLSQKVLLKQDIKKYEEAFLIDFKNDTPSRRKYNEIKDNYLPQ